MYRVSESISVLIRLFNVGSMSPSQYGEKSSTACPEGWRSLECCGVSGISDLELCKVLHSTRERYLRSTWPDPRRVKWCNDAAPVNTALKRLRWPFPTLEMADNPRLEYGQVQFPDERRWIWPASLTVNPSW